MDKRQRRIAKLAQALIDENLVDSNTQTSDEDFESVSMQESSGRTSSESDDSNNPEETDVTVTSAIQKAAVQSKSKKLQLIQQKQSARDILKQRLSKSTVKEQFKLSDEDWTKHMAVTTVWNQISRDKAATQLAMDTIQYQEAAELQQQQVKFTDSRPYLLTVQSSDPKHTMQTLLEHHFPQQAKYLMHCLIAQVQPEDFLLKPESKQVPDDCDYAQLFEAWQKRGKFFDRKVLKVTYENGKLLRFDGAEQRAQQLPGTFQSTNQLANPNTVAQQVGKQPNQPTKTGVQEQQSLTAAQRYQMQLLQKQKEMLMTQKNSLYTRTFKTQPHQDQTAYKISPNSKHTQTHVSFPEDALYWADYIIVFDAPRKNYFNKFYALSNGVPIPTAMNVQMQTDLVAKQLKGSTVSTNEPGDGANAFVLIDGDQFDLLKTDAKTMREHVLKCKELKIQRGKGRIGRVFNDFMQMLKRERRDIYDLGEELYVITRARAALEKDHVKEGTWLTLDGMYQLPAGEYEVADVPQSQFQVCANIIQYSVTNGHDVPGFLDKWFPQQLVDAGATAAKCKYVHPQTGEGYNSVHEYQSIQARLQQRESRELGQISAKLKQARADIARLLEAQQFEAADALFKDAFSLLAPSFAALQQDAPKQQTNMITKMLESCRHKPVE